MQNRSFNAEPMGDGQIYSRAAVAYRLGAKRGARSSVSTIFISCFMFLLLASTASASAAEADLATFRATVAPFVARHCADCHGADDPAAKLSLQAINGDVLSGKDIETWKQIADRLVLGEMPPEDEPRPDAIQTAKIVDWIKTELIKAGEDVREIGQKLSLPGHGNRVNHEALFSGKITAPVASQARVWRVRPQIYMSYVPRVSKNVRVGQPFSTSSAPGFKDYADLFVVDEPTINQLFRNARELVAVQCGESRFSKPLKEFETLLASAGNPAERTPAMEAAIRKQFQIALFRDPADAELTRFTELMEKNIADAGPGVGVKSTLAAILMLPEAMYRFELAAGEPDEYGRVMLPPRELAYAISFALTDSPPDNELLKAVETSFNAQPQALAESARSESASRSLRLGVKRAVADQVKRLLNDDRIQKPQIMRFFDQYFEYPAAEEVFKDLGRGQWRPEVLVNDTRMLIQMILDEDRDVLEQLLTTNKSFVNARFDTKESKYVPAKAVKKEEPKKDKKTGKLIPVPPRDPLTKAEVHDWYSLPLDWEWTDKQPVEFSRDQRAGILTQPSWLAAFASNNENHAIQRGKWVRERLLGGVVPDLPISVDAKLPDAPQETLRTRMEITRQDYCWQCHRKMNPLGLMFEHYDFLGRYRETEPVVDVEATGKNVNSKGEPQGTVVREMPVDATGVVARSGDAKIDGDYENAIAMIHALADSPRVRQVFVRHAFRFWMGRNETLADAPTLLAADQAYVESGGSMKALITSLLTSDSFLYRRHEQ